nr:MAG TPA: hypothetical protein [Caudoviricetes sp.]
MSLIYVLVYLNIAIKKATCKTEKFFLYLL